MYPLRSWQYVGLEARLNRLLAAELDFEAIVAATQVIEQIVKRILHDQMVRSRTCLNDTKGKRRLTVAHTPADVAATLRQCAQGIPNMKVAWANLMPAPHPTLPDLFDKIHGNGTWTVIVASDSFVPATGLGFLEYPTRGLAATRNEIVHGTRSPPAANVKTLAPFGVSVALRLVHPKDGVTSLGIRDPLTKAFAFRSRT